VAASAERERVVSKIDRYTAAFEAGTLEAGLFGENVQALKEQLQQLEAQRAELEAQRRNLRLPELDRAHILALLDDFEAVFDSATNPQRKHLLHQVVKEVRVHGKLSVEVTYFVPQPDPKDPVIRQPHMAPRVAQCTNRAVFRVLHDHHRGHHLPTRPTLDPSNAARQTSFSRGRPRVGASLAILRSKSRPSFRPSPCLTACGPIPQEPRSQAPTMRPVKRVSNSLGTVTGRTIATAMTGSGMQSTLISPTAGDSRGEGTAGDSAITHLTTNTLAVCSLSVVVIRIKYTPGPTLLAFHAIV
jgi:hypothetical protein